MAMSSFNLRRKIQIGEGNRRYHIIVNKGFKLLIDE